jgi:hypothetical protein
MWKLNMSSTHNFMALAVICLASVQALGGEGATVQPSSDGLSDVRQLLRAAIAHNKLSSLHNRPIRLIDVLYRSRWRNSISDVVRLLIGSDDNDERIIGWRMAQEHGVRMKWTESDIDRIIKEPAEDVKIAAIRSVATTDVGLLKMCIERVLEDPTATTRCKDACVLQLSKVPTLSHRVRLWLIAAGDHALRAACISSFPSVSSSESAIQVVASYLDDTSTVNVALSDDFGWPTEVRTLACQALSTVDVHKERAIDELRKRCKMPPETRDLEFFIAAMVAIHILSPDSAEPVEQIMKWYDELPVARPLFLQSLEEEFSDSDKFESLIISRSTEIPPDQRYCVCQWLSSRRSREATAALKELLLDSHPGVRVAAAVAQSKVDPLFDLSTMRESMLKAAVSSPEDFMIAFSSMSDAVGALALAGNSDEEAIEWLKRDRDAELRAICDEALKVLSAEMAMGLGRHIPWKKTTGVRQ